MLLRHPRSTLFPYTTLFRSKKFDICSSQRVGRVLIEPIFCFIITFPGQFPLELTLLCVCESASRLPHNLPICCIDYIGLSICLITFPIRSCPLGSDGFFYFIYLARFKVYIVYCQSSSIGAELMPARISLFELH